MENSKDEISPDAASIDSHTPVSIQFKKPNLMVGPRQGFHKFTKIKQLNQSSESSDTSDLPSDSPVPMQSPAEILKEKSQPLPYKEPSWAEIPKRKYYLEVIKDGTIVEQYKLTKSLFLFGRNSSVDCNLAHVSISRFHSVLQYGKMDGDSSDGFYLYDMNSTHGTFLNKSKVKPNIYIRLQVGHVIKLGFSSRLFILQGPPDDVEPESELGVTETRNLRLKEKLLKGLQSSKMDEEDDAGIDWGMSEDAEEETDLSVNPFAATQNEELYIDDPKKTLRGWFEREGCELQYDCQEKGFGQFVCRVELPIDDAHGNNIVAEAVVKGKKKEAVIQCALEACRIIDQHGLLRQSTHESRKKKAKDWEADDFYDSDEDNYLDRTGTIERKREKRMAAAGVAPTVHTYSSLLARHKELVEEGRKLEEAIAEASKPAESATAKDDDELEQYMAALAAEGPGKAKVSSLKVELSRIKQEEVKVRGLANIARGAGVEALQCPWTEEEATAAAPKPKQLPIIGKRRAFLKKTEVKKVKPSVSQPTPSNDDGEEFDSD